MGCSASAASPAVAESQECVIRKDSFEDRQMQSKIPSDNYTTGLEISFAAGSATSSAKQKPRYSSSGCDEFHSKYLLGDKLGMGAFAQVRVGIQADDPSVEFAVKIMNLTADSLEEQESALKFAHIEEAIWKTVGQHKHCVGLLEAFHGNVLSYMVMEKCNSSLLRHIHYMPSVNERTLGHLFVDMLHGLAHVHSVGVVHRDVKPDNFLIGLDGCTVKLCDFGLSETLNRSGKLSGPAGTAPFMCPEMLRAKDYDGRADVWSLGVIVYAFLFGTFPYVPKEKTSKAMMKAILLGQTPKFEPVGCSGPAKDSFRTASAQAITKALLNRDVELRPTAAKALKMKFMKEIVDNRHEQTPTQLPSLRPMLLSAKKLGAFEIRNLCCQDDVDCILNDFQIKKHGLSNFKLKDNQLTPPHSTPPIKAGGIEVPWRRCSDDDCSTSCTSGSSSRKTSAQGSDWSKENSNQWSVTYSIPPSEPRHGSIPASEPRHGRTQV